MSLWSGPDPEKLKAFAGCFPRVDPLNPAQLPADQAVKLMADGEERWAKVRDQIRAEFEAVINGAVPSGEWVRRGLHPKQVEKLFEWRLRQMLYEPQLAAGGSEETRISVRLLRLARKLDEHSDRLPAGARGLLLMLSQKYRELPGRYFIYKNLSPELKVVWEKAQKSALSHDDVEAARAAEVVLKGIPERITDFVIEPLYVLVRVNGTRERVVRILNVHGEIKGPLRWPSEQFSSPKAMRVWLNDNANCANWAAGERELNYLGMDIGQALAHKEVNEVPLRGHHYQSGIWFFADCALLDGKPLPRDKNGVYWHNGGGYLPSEKDQEGDNFRMGPSSQMPGPFMHPAIAVTEAEARGVFLRFAQDMHDAIGGYVGWLMIGAMLAFFAAKEIFQRYTAVPGLWTSGEPAQGKSSAVRWLMRIMGYQGKTGVPWTGSTQAATRGALQQYGDIPLWMDEFQARCDTWVIDVAKAAYDRGGTIKKTFGELPREIRTGLMISGVATSTDAQLRSRYIHVQVAAANRIHFDNDRYQDLDKWSLTQLYKLGRYLLTRREDFARLTIEQMGFWMKDPKLVNCDDRSRIVHGAAHSAFVALASMLGSCPEPDGPASLTHFKQFVRKHIEAAQGDMRDQLYVTHFFDHLLGAWRAGMFMPRGSLTDLKHYFHLVPKPDRDADKAVTDYQRRRAAENGMGYAAWQGYYLDLNCEAVVEVVMAYRRTKLGITENLSRKDLQEQMTGRPWFVKNKRGRWSVKFEGGGQEPAWKIDLDQHEMGRLAVTDEDFEESLHPAGRKDVLIERLDWTDPRKGPLYAIVEQLKRKESKD